MTNSQQYRAEVLKDRYALKVAAHLSTAAESLPHDIQERLRVARQQAVARRKVEQTRPAFQVIASGGAAVLGFGDDQRGWLDRAAAFLPLVALLAGLVIVNAVQNDRAALELADVDAALLVDDLPPVAYVDPGFAQFLKLSRQGAQ